LPSPYQPESLLALRSAGAARGGYTALTGDAAPLFFCRSLDKMSSFV